MKKSQDINIGNEILLLDDHTIYHQAEVEGYEKNNKYMVSDIRIKNGDTQIFLKGNIHAYGIDSFLEDTK